MIPKNVIEKAIEGGWIATMCVEVEKNYIWFQHQIALDPSFWQSLVKSFGLYCPWCSRLSHECEKKLFGCITEPIAFRCAQEFFSLILFGKDPADFWQELLTKQ